MSFNPEVFKFQYPIVQEFIRHIKYSRLLLKFMNERKVKNNFLHYTYISHLNEAALLWCKVFGSHGCQPTHLRNLNKENENDLTESFQVGLFKNTNLTQTSWQNYWNEIKEFRDKHVSHTELNETYKTPKFDTAIEVAFYYDNWVREIIYPDVLNVMPLKKFSDEISESFNAEIAELRYD